MEYTLVAINNLEKRYIELDENITKEKLEEVFSLISNNFEIEFTGSEPIKESFSSEGKVAKKRFFKIRKKQIQNKQIKKVLESVKTMTNSFKVFGLYKKGKVVKG